MAALVRILYAIFFQEGAPRRKRRDGSQADSGAAIEDKLREARGTALPPARSIPVTAWRQQADTTAVTWAYGYDAADQLTSALKRATDAQQTILQRYGYAYDPARNRLVEQIDDQVTGVTYNKVNELVTQHICGQVGLRNGKVVLGSQLDQMTDTALSHIVDKTNVFARISPAQKLAVCQPP